MHIEDKWYTNDIYIYIQYMDVNKNWMWKLEMRSFWKEFPFGSLHSGSNFWSLGGEQKYFFAKIPLDSILSQMKRSDYWQLNLQLRRCYGRTPQALTCIDNSSVASLGQLLPRNYAFCQWMGIPWNAQNKLHPSTLGCPSQKKRWRKNPQVAKL